MAAARKPGLWFRRLSVEIQEVRTVHRLPCLGCKKIPKGQRLRLEVGSGRYMAVIILCSTCGYGFAHELRLEAERVAGALSYRPPEGSDCRSVALGDLMVKHREMKKAKDA